MIYPEDFIEIVDDMTVNVTIKNIISGEPEEHQVSMSDLRNYILRYRNSIESIRFLGSICGEHRQMDDLSHILDDFWSELHGKDRYQELVDSIQE